MKKQLLATLAMNLLLVGCSSSSQTSTKEVSSPNPTFESVSEDIVSPQWKKTMNAYEEFFNEYVEFMKNYDPSTLDSEMITRYTELLKKYNEYFGELEDVDEQSLSTADRAYYIEVNGRIQKKLLEISQ